MQKIGFLLLSSLFPLINAQYGGGGSSNEESTTSHATATSTASAAATVQTVKVGEDGLSFNPDTLTAAPGGKVEFHFFPGGHSVAQAAFSNPCHPLSGSGVYSGVISSNSGEAAEVFTLTINDTNPIWYYCGQVGHCQAGMVGVINPPSNGPDTLAAFKSAASSAGGTTVPNSVGGGIVGKPQNESTSITTTTSAGHSSTPTPSPTGEGSTLNAISSLGVVLVLSAFVAINMV